MVWKHDTVAGADGKARCGWASADPLYQKYHDSEWGRPLKDDRALFELLTLEGCQAGLSLDHGAAQARALSQGL